MGGTPSIGCPARGYLIAALASDRRKTATDERGRPTTPADEDRQQRQEDQSPVAVSRFPA